MSDYKLIVDELLRRDGLNKNRPIRLQSPLYKNAADAIKALEAENAGFLEQLALRSESNMHKDMQEIMRINNQLNARIAELEADNERLREALKPFADVPSHGEFGGPMVQARVYYECEPNDRCGVVRIDSSAFRAARAAYLGENKP